MNVKQLMSVVLLLFTANIMASQAKEQNTSTALTDVVAFSVNINQASADEMSALLKGIGPAKAHAIVDYREQYGPFLSIDDIVKVKGIGPKFLEKNRSHLSVSQPKQSE